nr:uncharacterized protein LOC117279996 [Nicotiana tomentosiformis]XP_033517243.1 uncharacterized protein LOC117281504 [Nicotiana tomentosiformis]
MGGRNNKGKAILNDPKYAPQHKFLQEYIVETKDIDQHTKREKDIDERGDNLYKQIGEHGRIVVDTEKTAQDLKNFLQKRFNENNPWRGTVCTKYADPRDSAATHKLDKRIYELEKIYGEYITFKYT